MESKYKHRKERKSDRNRERDGIEEVMGEIKEGGRMRQSERQ